MSPWPAVVVSGGRDKGRHGIAVMINDLAAFSTDLDLVERTLAGKLRDRGDKMGGGRTPRFTLAARGTIQCVAESMNEHMALKGRVRLIESVSKVRGIDAVKPLADATQPMQRSGSA